MKGATTKIMVTSIMLLWLSVVDALIGDFDGYVDLTFSCPARTTCPRVCVANVTDCPATMLCEDDEELCADGTCAKECNQNLGSPCPYDCAPVVCAKIVDFYDSCNELYADYYDSESTCGEEEEFYETTLYEFNEPAFIFSYIWGSTVTFLIWFWCFFNQCLFPVSGSTQPLQVEKTSSSKKDSPDVSKFANEAEYAAADSELPDPDSELCLQTGYRYHFAGVITRVLTMLTWAGWNIALGFLTIQYYVWNESEKVDKRKLHFEDEEQLLKAFIIAWNCGFVFCFALKWPYSMSSLFLRRCELSEAQQVAVYLNVKDDRAEPVSKNAGAFYTFSSSMFAWWMSFFKSVMSLIFSDRDSFDSRPGVYRFCKVHTGPNGTRYFTFLLRRYNLDPEKGVFVPGVWTVGETVRDLVDAGTKEGGLTTEEVEKTLGTVGLNSIDLEKPSYMKSLAEELTQPFYTYQLFMIWSWMPLYYYYMAMIWAFVVAVSALVVSFFHYRNLRNLYKITHVEGRCNVLRDGQMQNIDKAELVPGDIIQPSVGEIYCDMVLISGDKVIVDESALTGESSPQAKAPLSGIDSSINFDRTLHKRHIMSAGTNIVETNEHTRALILETGSHTAKGQMLRDIFAFTRHRFKFDQEVMVVLGILLLYAVFGFNIVVVFIEDTPVYGWFYGMYVVASILPPLLPTVFTVSVGVSDERLTRKGVPSVNSEAILIAGKVTHAFFDKTGTLTKQGLDFIQDKTVDEMTGVKQEADSNNLGLAMSCCHSLTQTRNGKLVGNPVDQGMFVASGATLGDAYITARDGTILHVLRYFDFDHHRMTMSVVVQLPDDSLVAFVKGSGESIKKICKTSVPENFDTLLRESALDRIYQISVAYKTLSKNVNFETLTRDEVESGLDFLGVLDFKNVIRDDTVDVIKQLADGEVVSTVVTGDNTLTGIKVAQEAGILSAESTVLIGNKTNAGGVQWTRENGEDVEAFPGLIPLQKGKIELAVSGEAWGTMLEHDFANALELVEYIKVFGRCTPQDKVSVVNTFAIDLGKVTLMCGDGGNDCGALKAAHVGIALSDAEASVVAPFTSVDKKISSVIDVLKEGRCALASALASYKYMIMYGQVETANQIINAWFQVTFAGWNWVFMDGVWLITLALMLPLAKPADKLANTRPTASILGAHTLASALGVFALHFIFTMIALWYLFSQDWFQCRKWDESDVSDVTAIGDNYESEVVWLVTGYQYISSAIVYNFGYEWRKGWWHNYLLVLFIVGYTVLHAYVTLVPSKTSCFFRVNCQNEDVVVGILEGWVPIQNPFNTTIMPEHFRRGIFFIMLVNTVAVVVYETLVVNGLRRRWGRQKRAKEAAELLALNENDTA